MLEFHEKNIIKKAIIYGDKYYYNKHINNHLELLENIIGLEFMTDKLYRNFIKKYNPIFIYFFPNNYVVFSSFEKVSIFKVIDLLIKENIPINNLYKKHEFEKLVDYCTFSKINIVQYNKEGEKNSFTI